MEYSRKRFAVISFPFVEHETGSVVFNKLEEEDMDGGVRKTSKKIVTIVLVREDKGDNKFGGGIC